MGGPSTGGNYWWDYNGTDLTYDGFGDTSLPFGPGDEMPLIDLRGEITIDLANVTDPVSGHRFDIEFDVTPVHPWIPTNYTLAIHFTDGGGRTISSTISEEYVPIDGIVGTGVIVPENAFTAIVRLNVIDPYGKEASYSRSFDVIDGRSPDLELMERSSFHTGEPAWIVIGAPDDRGIERLDLRIFWNDLDHELSPDSVENIGNIWTVNFTIPPSCIRLMFNVSVTDGSGKSTERDIGWCHVTDSIEPEVEILSDDRMYGGGYYELVFNASDNIGIATAMATLLIGEGGITMGLDWNGSEYRSRAWIYDLVCVRR